MNPNGVILFEGKSKIDGTPIAVIMTGIAKNSNNVKTGHMLQTYVVQQNISPIESYMKGKSHAVCGDCKHSLMRTCYVNRGQGVGRVWDCYKRGNYAKLNKEIEEKIRGKKIRIGTYGDPAAVPVAVWDKLIKLASGYTAYTHQWNKPKYAYLKRICIASVDTVEEYKKAQAMGWRTFRVMPLGDTELMKKEMSCPASKEGGQKTVCAKCCSCNGLDKKWSFTIQAHGASARRYTKLMSKS